MPTVQESIKAFLKARQATHNGPDLISRYLEHAFHLETQVNVFAGNGWPVDTKRSTYTDGIDEWFNIRIPRNANADPVFKDYELRFPLDVHADAIGCTGWDWVNRCSRWVGFDFDSITGHAAGVGVDKEELARVREAAKALPYVEVRKSTGGLGLHLYVIFGDRGVLTRNHTEHAALGRAILGMMSSETGFDFATQIDACGGNMWLWARKMSSQNEGLKLIKPAETTLGEETLPTNWRAHVDVVTRKRTKVRVNGIDEADYDPFEALANSRQIVPLDSKHKQVIEELQRSGYTTIWVSDHHLLQTHTCALQGLMERKDELGLVGFFKTISNGRDPGQPNCFAFPVDTGGWKVYKFSPGNVEDLTWDQDGEGWTTCYFNRSPNLKVAARALGGIEDAEKGGFVFDSLDDTVATAGALGQAIKLPDDVPDRETTIKSHKDGRMVIKINKHDDDEAGKWKGAGWQSKKGYWLQVFETKTDRKKNDESTIAEFDHVVRALITPDGKRAGWASKQANGEWIWCPKDDAKSLLLWLDYAKPEAERMLGGATSASWKIVNIPFCDEYPGNRQWNLRAPQYRFKPADLTDDEPPFHPHWDMVLRHCGQDLDESVLELDWAREANICSGADYLLHWSACMLREPYAKLPYLFFYGDQNSGKSIFHEALSLLMTDGVAAADRALTSEFNGELANAVLAVVEEKDISNSPGAYNRLKDLVTSPTIWIRKMRTDAYPQVSTLHFVHTANEREAIVIKLGDLRIVVIFVPMLEPGQEIPKPILMQRLESEAPHFMRTVMDLKLPPMIGRMRLPVISTSAKERAEELSRSPLQMFLADHCHAVPGEMVPFKDFFKKFCDWLEEDRPPEFEKWSNKHQVLKNLPDSFPFGKHNYNQRYIGNIAWGPCAPGVPLVLQGGRLKPKE